MAKEQSHLKKAPKYVEPGITSTVKTIFSKTTVEDIIDAITDVKVNAIISYLEKNNIEPKNTLIVGVYLTGAKIANYLVETNPVTAVDIHPHLKFFLKPSVSFKNSLYELENSETFDLIIDTTGLGGLSLDEIKLLQSPTIFLAENPTSEGSDDLIKKIDATELRLNYFDAQYKGQLFSGGLNTKTSGTMTFTVEVLRNSMQDALQQEGVLYTTSSLDFYERILFQEKDISTFLKTIQRSALVISSLEEIDCDLIIEKNLKKITSTILDE